MELTQDYVKSLFEYRNGRLFRRISRNFKNKVGSLASCFNMKHNRFEVKIDGKSYYVSRIIFLYHNGFMPLFVDHINRNPLDDRIENLRSATRGENTRNRTSATGSTSRYLGVSWNVSSNKWIARICTDSKSIFLCISESENKCALAYNRAAVMYHKEFANLNIIQP